jgi:predicted DNA-binding ribbon-helix-helix protein
MTKRSITLNGHATSFTLEDEFWDILKDVASTRGQSVASLVSEIDEDRLKENQHGLSSSIRIYIIKYLKSKIDQTNS